MSLQRLLIHRLAPVLLSCASVQAGPQAPVRELALHEPPGTRVEYFVLELAGEERPVGTLRMLVGPDPEARVAGAEGMRLEAELGFFEDGVRVLHAERVRFEADRETSTLVWREIRPFAGRTVLVEGERGQVFRSQETSGGEVLRQVHAGSRGAAFPLALVEAVRSGEALPERLEVYQPLGGGFEEFFVTTSLYEGGGAPERVLELHRGDGSLARRYVFRADRLVRLELQAGGLVARSTTRRDYEGLSQRCVNNASEDEPGTR